MTPHVEPWLGPPMDPERGILGVDIETASAADIKQGAWNYARHPSTRVWCVVLGYALDNKDSYHTFRWRPGVRLPRAFGDYVRAGGSVLAHNASFEKAVFRHVLAPRFDFPDVPRAQWRDTQANALALNLPMALGGLARALGCTVLKDSEGAKVMKSIATAEPDGAGGWVYSELATPENLTRVIDYCCRDVGAMLDAWFRMQPLIVREAAVWRVDQIVNDRGLFIDQDFADKLARMARARQVHLSDDAFAVTTGELANATAAPALKSWLAANGVTLPKVTRKKKDGTFTKTETVGKAAVESLLKEGELPDVVRRVLLNRIEANKATSLAKLNRVPLMVGADGRLRNALQFHGAHTGRWASYGLQVHNLPKDKLSPAASSLARLMVDRADLDGLTLCEDRPLAVMSQLLRSCIAAPAGRELVAADYSAIEARVLAWLCEDDALLDVFARGEDVYTYTAEGIGSDDRQLGKVCCLALGYGMGALKFATTAAGWGVPLELKEARRVQKLWRETNPTIVGFWRELESAVRSAIKAPGTTFHAGRIRCQASKTCLFLVLPSGRSIRYWRPAVRQVTKTIKTVDDDGRVIEREFEAQEIQFYTMGPTKSAMVRDSTYGGKLVENVTQAVARDLLADALVRVEAHDAYDVVVHVHDSIAAEVDEGAGDVGEFCKLMAKLPRWAEGLPVDVEGYRAKHFRG